MSVCYHCQRKHEGCHASCTDHLTETLINDLVNMKKRKERRVQQDAKGVSVRRWEINNHRRARQL